MNSLNAFEELKNEIRQRIEHYVENNVPEYTKERLSEAMFGVFLGNVSKVNEVMNGDLPEEDIERHMYIPASPKQSNQNPIQLELPLENRYKPEPIIKNENDLW